MPVRDLLIPAALAACLVMAGPAACTTTILIASARYSTVPPVLIGSPDGSIVSNIIVRDQYNQPLGFSAVEISLQLCSGFVRCASPCDGCVPGMTPKSVLLFTDSSGLAAFHLRIGASGCPDPPSALVWADGVPLATPRFASLDQDGDLTVTLGDVAIATGLVGSADLRADFDGDRVVTATDVAMIEAHLWTGCIAPVPALRRSWGTLKSIYR